MKSLALILCVLLAGILSVAWMVESEECCNGQPAGNGGWCCCDYGYTGEGETFGCKTEKEGNQLFSSTKCSKKCSWDWNSDRIDSSCVQVFYSEGCPSTFTACH